MVETRVIHLNLELEKGLAGAHCISFVLPRDKENKHLIRQAQRRMIPSSFFDFFAED